VIGNWNTTSFTGKKDELVEEAKRYSLDVVGIIVTQGHNKNEFIAVC